MSCYTTLNKHNALFQKYGKWQNNTMNKNYNNIVLVIVIVIVIIQYLGN